MLHPSITRSIEEIESALFSDDTFACPKENYLLAGKLIFWLERLQSLRGLPKEDSGNHFSDGTPQTIAVTNILNSHPNTALVELTLAHLSRLMQDWMRNSRGVSEYEQRVAKPLFDALNLNVDDYI